MVIPFAPSLFSFGLSILPNLFASIGQGLSKSRVDRDMLRMEKKRRLQDIGESSNDLITSIDLSNMAGGVSEGTHTPIIRQKAAQAVNQLEWLTKKQERIMKSSRNSDFTISGATAGLSLAGLYGFNKLFGPKGGGYS